MNLALVWALSVVLRCIFWGLCFGVFNSMHETCFVCWDEQRSINCAEGPGTVDISYSPIVSSFGTKLGLLAGMIRNRPRNPRYSRNLMTLSPTHTFAFSIQLEKAFSSVWVSSFCPTQRDSMWTSDAVRNELLKALLTLLCELQNVLLCLILIWH